MIRVIAFDPGYITGIACGTYEEDEPLRVTSHTAITYEEILDSFYDFDGMNRGIDHVVSEHFVLRDNNFKADLTPKKVEGILDVAFNGRVIYRDPSKKSQVSDDTLKEHGLWVTGKQVNWTDGRDVNDAILHLLGYVAFDLKHKPTLMEYFK